MLETIPLQEPDLLGRTETLLLTLDQFVDQHGRHAHVLNAAGMDTAFLQQLQLLHRRRRRLPGEGRGVGGQIVRTNGNGVLQRVYQPTLSVSHVLQLTGQGLLTFRDSVMLGLLLCVHEVNACCVVLQHPVHALCLILILRDQRGRPAQIMALRHPQKIQYQQVFLAGERPQATSDDLAIPHDGDLAVTPGNQGTEFVLHTPTGFRGVLLPAPAGMVGIPATDTYEILLFQVKCVQRALTPIRRDADISPIPALKSHDLQALDEQTVAIGNVV